jgi:hypothetical protein
MERRIVCPLMWHGEMQDASVHKESGRQSKRDTTGAMSTERKAQLASVVRAYFDGLNSKNISAVPWSDTVTLRAPLAEGGSDKLSLAAMW